MRNDQDQMSEKEILQRILEILVSIDQKIDRLVPKGISLNRTTSLEGEKEGPYTGLDVMTLLSLPEHLRTTATILFELGTATAEDVSRATLKERAVESGYLNQLVRMGHVTKYRTGRKVYFCISGNKKTD
ncbi:MAG: transcriptional regulator [Methanomethylovorans sp.]|nr:transcriptional regulator [Methanomethylovorans sp.]